MSQQLINRSPDLKRLRDEGYAVEVWGSYLLIKQVPYVNSAKQIQYGILVSDLSLAGDVTTTPGTHVAYFTGDYPCHADGATITQIAHASGQRALDRDLVIQHSFSSKPSGGYKDYYDKMATYVAILSSPAQSLDPGVTATPFPTIEASPDESVFHYVDTVSSRAQINLVTRKLEIGRIAIIGLGGTGSYVLDLVAKTPVKEIHLFDGDKFSQHNAFRSPGAPSLEELRQEPLKVSYFKDLYSRMHRNIIAHDGFLDETNVGELHAMDFVFLCLDGGDAKRLAVRKLEEFGRPFIDVGMGVHLVDDTLIGVLRITTSTADKRDHVQLKNRIPFSDGSANNEYARNIQIADLNALNAALAVVKWKKLFGFYQDLEREHFSAYTIDGNALVNEDQS